MKGLIPDIPSLFMKIENPEIIAVNRTNNIPLFLSIKF